MSEPIPFTGYVPENEPREQLASQCIDYDFSQFTCSGDIPDTRNIKDMMRRQPLFQVVE